MVAADFVSATRLARGLLAIAAARGTGAVSKITVVNKYYLPHEKSRHFPEAKHVQQSEEDRGSQLRPVRNECRRTPVETGGDKHSIKWVSPPYHD
jgi:hypothetical protein